MATNRKKASKKAAPKVTRDEDPEPVEDPTEHNPGDTNPDFGKPTVNSVDELLKLLEDGEEPEDETPVERFEWDDDIIEFPLRKKYKFRAEKTYYRLQLASQPDYVDPATRQIIKGKNKAAQFTNGRYDTRDQEVARLIYRSKAMRVRGTIEDIDEVNRVAKEQNYQALKSTLTTASDKKRLLRELIQELREEAASE
jgi:hypothetical protein